MATEADVDSVWEETGYSRESSPKNTPATDHARTYPLKPSEKTLSRLASSSAELVYVRMKNQLSTGDNGNRKLVNRERAEWLIKNNKADLWE